MCSRASRQKVNVFQGPLGAVYDLRPVTRWPPYFRFGKVNIAEHNLHSRYPNKIIIVMVFAYQEVSRIRSSVHLLGCSLKDIVSFSFKFGTDMGVN